MSDSAYALLALACACVCLSLTTAVLGACVPFLFRWALRSDERLRRVEEAVEKLDEALASVVEVASGSKR